MLTSVRFFIRALLPANDRGQDLVEYALLGGLIAFALLGVVVVGLTDGLDKMFSGIGACIDFDPDSDCF